MTAVVEARLSAERFALNESFGRIPDLDVEVVRTAGSGVRETGGDALPYLRASTDAEVDLREVLADDPTTERVEELGATWNPPLFHVEWAPAVLIPLRCLSVRGATILEARGANGEWRFQLLFPEHDGVRSTFDVCEAYDIDLDLQRLSSLGDPFPDDRGSITRLQLETIQEAYESGYYEVPREASLVDLATKIDVSHQALSERLRRGHGALVRNSLASRGT